MLLEVFTTYDLGAVAWVATRPVTGGHPYLCVIRNIWQRFGCAVRSGKYTFLCFVHSLTATPEVLAKSSKRVNKETIDQKHEVEVESAVECCP